MDNEEGMAEQYSPHLGVGERLRAAREAKGLSLEHIAAETRITERHLQQIEQGDFAALPARAYAVGFSRSYAKLVGLDEHEVARDVRAELSGMEPDESARSHSFEPGDPARVPSARTAWLAALVGLAIFLTGSAFLWSSFVAPSGELPWLTQDEPASTEIAGQGAPAPGAATIQQQPNPVRPVVFTAIEDGIWVKFYDSSGTQLMQKQMKLGETYTVPVDADGPLIWTGRPDALEITVGGDPVPKLAETDRIMKDIPVTAEALLSRNGAVESASPTA